ncbi:MAG: MoaD/ThiS family protein [Anaerolineae bacterium]|nr:MoaD/ThiS family protein [Anaerolineae bacterium]
MPTEAEGAHVQVVVRLFAAVREALGQETLTLRLPAGSTVRHAREEVERLAPEARPLLQRCLPARNREFASLDDPVHEGDELAFLPPVGGG